MLDDVRGQGVTPFPVRDMVLTRLNRGRDAATPIGELAETLKLTRRQVELAVRELRLDGWPVSSGSEGVWLASIEELHATIDSLQRRTIQQYLTLRALRETEKRMARALYPEQTVIGWVDIA